MKKTVFIHTNDKQMIGAIVGRRSLKRAAADPTSFDVRITRAEDFPFFREFEERKFLRGGNWREWRNDDLQSFTPVRFAPPELMGYEGRAIVTDPDVFAVRDVNELFERDMRGAAICARPRPGHKGKATYVASSVMLLDCARLTHWNLRRQFEALFAGEMDYEDWIELALEPEGSIGHLEPHWNDFDRLAGDTRLIHNTKRRTQPWKSGLPIDYTNRPPWMLRKLGFASFRLPLRYLSHPDPRQEKLFFGLLRECMEAGEVTEEMLEREITRRHVRPDAATLVAEAPPVDDVLRPLREAA